MPKRRALVLNKKDNVANLLEDLQPGESIDVDLLPDRIRIEAKELIPFGFKMAISDIRPGEPIVKYGEIIGTAACPIAAGEQVHVHNLAGARGRGDLVHPDRQGN